MTNIDDGYYFMFEIGWFIDLLIPTITRVKDGNIYFVGSKPFEAKDLKPCCIPAGGAEECKKFPLTDPSLNAFKSIDSLVAVQNLEDLQGELDKSLDNGEIQEKYFNTKTKRQRKATIDRIKNDYRVLSSLTV